MFRNKITNNIIPQINHANMVGNLANYYGNNKFIRPKIDWNSFIFASYIHDNGFGSSSNDTYEIGVMDEISRRSVVENCINIDFNDDITAEIIVKQHFLRLLSEGSYSFPDIKNRLADEISTSMESSSYKESDYNKADKVIDLLDAISFDFSWGVNSNYSVSLATKKGFTEVNYKIEGEKIYLSDWIFRVGQIEGSIISYEAGVYPNTLNPRHMHYQIMPM